MHPALIVVSLQDVDLKYILDAHASKADEKREAKFDALFGDEDYVETPRYSMSRNSAFGSRR